MWLPWSREASVVLGFLTKQSIDFLYHSSAESLDIVTQTQHLMIVNIASITLLALKSSNMHKHIPRRAPINDNTKVKGH